MTIRRVLALAAIPFVMGTFGFVAPSQANAANPSEHHTQIAQQPRKPVQELQKPDKKAEIKHRQQRLDKKPRHPQPHHRGTERNQRGNINEL
ncbi:hypothetical protein [Nostoc sp. FACHB-110]|uniref:hypothetical protein n=1 Tax=Nostoc sp. FACHB-110 TaxID=2692834 RepID=UPI001683BE26|nr:hypothetical protein [Nostoc sp. FACHB-110]MBD2436549.1 hypothetical protein [Nostoc sp. FACHB-110]